ncbi:MAG: ExbD/TolR family protein [Planctomycetales bacterium]
MRVPSHHSRGDISENMMTSMIDVVFLLLIFFVCAAAGNVFELLLPTDLAEKGAAGTAPQVETVVPVDRVWIALSRGDQRQLVMRLNETDYESHDDLRGVLLSLAEVAPESPVILQIAPEVEAEHWVRVYDTCRAARFQSINFQVQAPPSAGDETSQP